ncbi:MAG: hypothetical protein U1F54_06925 [Burkholderiales bacterium]
MIDEYVRWAATTGPSFVPAWSNANVVLVVLAVFAVSFLVGAFTQWQWLFDAAFLSLVTGGILVAWPAMVVLSIASVFAAMLLSLLHRLVAPKQSARIDAEGEQRALEAVGELARELPGGEEALRSVREARDRK